MPLSQVFEEDRSVWGAGSQLEDDDIGLYCVQVNCYEGQLGQAYMPTMYFSVCLTNETPPCKYQRQSSASMRIHSESLLIQTGWTAVGWSFHTCSQR